MRNKSKFALVIIVLLIFAPAAISQNYHSGHGQHGELQSSKLNYDSLFNEATPLSKSIEGQALIENCITKYGGTELLSKLNSYQLNYSMLPLMVKDSIAVSKYFERGYKYKIEKIGAEKDETRIFNGANSWFQNMDTVMVLDSGRYKSEYFSYLTLTMPWGMKDNNFNQIRYGARDGDSLSYIYMVKTDTLMIVLGIDPNDHFVKSSEGIIYQGTGNFVFINHFSDFNKVDGYYFPFTLVNISMGLEVAKSHLKDVIVNKKFDENIFQPGIRNKRKTY